jgi:DNA uptake protein ComE-like DNA-binding protein
MPELAHKLLTFKPAPDPMQEKVKELELKKLEMEVEELQSKIDLNRAKAKEASSKADNADLAYVENESGIAHERDMEKLNAQGQANIDHTITKAIVSPKKEGEKAPDIAGGVGFAQLAKARDSQSSVPPVSSVLPPPRHLQSPQPQLPVDGAAMPPVDPETNPEGMGI